MTRSLRILVVDDERAQREILVEILQGEGYRPRAAGSGAEAIGLLGEESFGLVITDLRMPEMDGLELLERVRLAAPEVPVLLMTAYGSVSSAVQAMQNGAYDYLQKPFDKDELIQRVRRVAERNALVTENERLRKELGAKAAPPMLGESVAMQKLRRQIVRLGQVAGDVLVSGESGTGKELVARALHYGGTRAGGPFVPVNCAAIPAELAESELFGHEKGAFTHALSTRIGRFEQADGGTLFLDEISSMPLLLQVKLLRVVEDRAIERVGATKRVGVDIRILAATNRDLPAMIAAGEFREDLYQRLNVHELFLPPLRERGEDIQLLTEHFRDRAALRFDVPAPDISAELTSFLRAYDFPGNVRELQHMMEKMVVLSDGDTLTLGDLPHSVLRRVPRRHSSVEEGQGGSKQNDPVPGNFGEGEAGEAQSSATRQETPSATQGASGDPSSRPEELLSSGPISLPDVEERLLREAIRRAGGNLSEAARQLSISYKTMRYRARKFGLDGE